MYFIILLETYDWASASPLYCDGTSALFYWCESIASAPEPERLPIKPRPLSSAGFGPLPQFFRMLAKFFNLTVLYFRSSPMEKRKACIQYRHSSRMRERKPSKRLFLSEAASSCEGLTRDFPHDGGWPIQPSLRVGRQGVSFKHRADMPETEQHSHWK